MLKSNVISNKSSLFLLLFCVLFLCTNSADTQAGEIIGEVKLQDCILDEDGLDCDEKMVFTVPVSFGLSATVDAVITGGPRGGLEETIRIEITKTQPELIYPLKHFHTVAYYPHEEVIQVYHSPGGFPLCIDCVTADYPTCGWTYQSSNKIPHSQGFCTAKSFYDLLYAEESCSWWRGEEILQQRATMNNPFSTGHAMRPGELYFHGYEIGEHVKSYEIKVVMTKGGDSVEFNLSPPDPLYVNTESDFKVKAKLLGDMDEYKQDPQFDNYILYIPSAPDTHPMVEDYQNNMLLVPREETSKDGGEADKVGVSFYTFRQQAGNSEKSSAGDGLHNQLFQKHNLDLQTLVLNPNAELTYLVHGMKDFKGSMEFESGMDKALVHKIPNIENSLVSLTMDYAELKSINTQSIGIIEEAYVKTFTSMSDEGTMVVKITNYGDFPTDYIVTVTDCSMPICGAIPAQARSLNPTGSADLYFDVSTLDNLDATHECLVSLTGPTGAKYDSVWVVFDTKKHYSKYSWEFQEENEASVAVPDEIIPVIILNGNNPLVLECGTEYIEPGATVIDDDPNLPVYIGGDIIDPMTCGTYEITYDATDTEGNDAVQVIRTVIVQDTLPPEFIITVSPDVLRPPNHKMVEIDIDIRFPDDACCPPEPTLLSITTNEDDNNSGDGDTTNDILVEFDGTIYLRAERNGNGTGRIYTITYQAVNDAGVVSTQSATVTVP